MILTCVFCSFFIRMVFLPNHFFLLLQRRKSPVFWHAASRIIQTLSFLALTANESIQSPLTNWARFNSVLRNNTKQVPNVIQSVLNGSFGRSTTRNVPPLHTEMWLVRSHWMGTEGFPSILVPSNTVPETKDHSVRFLSCESRNWRKGANVSRTATDFGPVFPILV